MIGIKHVVLYICMLQVIFRHSTGTMAVKVSITQNITGLLGKKDIHLTCSFFPENGEQIFSVQIIAKKISEDFDEKKNIIAVFNHGKAAKLTRSGGYLDGRVTLTNTETNSSHNATLKFHILEMIDEKDYMCKWFYSDMEDAIQNVKSDATRILVKVPVRDVIISKQPNNKKYDEKTDNITLTCTANGNPKPQYIWFKENNSNNVISRTNHYVIDDVIRNNSGIYICESYNNINNVNFTHSNSVKIIIEKLLPKIESESPKIFAVHAAFAIPVTCAVVFVVICFTVRKRNYKRQERNEQAVTVIYSEVNEETKLKYRLTHIQATALNHYNVQQDAVDGALEVSSDPTLKYNMITGKLEVHTIV